MKPAQESSLSLSFHFRAKSSFFQSNLRGIAFDSSEYWGEDGGGGWATSSAVLLILCWQLLRAFRKRLAATPTPVVLSAKATPVSCRSIQLQQGDP
ncbi:hypothetical protein KSP39_PZI010618 [Platanthera zijinensis]|uniref:Uncharacterized protein n=1 Tax=Platanthera zijinensis TaxID=2320716 RepID=A0AAP0G6G0_9ASPA